MASAVQVVGGLEESSSSSSMQDCCLPFKKVMPKCTLDTATSQNFLCNKKRKVDDQPSFASSSSSTCSSKQIDNESSEDEADQRSGSASTAFDERLSTLQQLLPQGLELEEDEVLRVAIEYVKELEREIQMFHSSPAEGCAKLEHTINESINDSPLQRRGLCIVPLSTLAKAL